MKVYEKLAYIQKTLKVSKENYNSFGKYKYRSCEDILEGVKPLCEEVKTVLTLTDAVVQIGDRYYIKATASLFDIESGDSVITDAYAREDLDKKGMDLAQVTGSVSSYARKYALNGLFCIDDTKDSDATNKHGQDEPKDPPTFPKAVELVTKEQATELVNMAREKWGENAGECFAKYTGYAKSEKVLADKFEEVKKLINKAAPF